MDSDTPATEPAAELAFEIVSRENQPVLCLRGPLGIADVHALRDVALRFTENVNDTATHAACVDLTSIEGTDAGILQVLASLDAEFRRRDWRLILDGPPETVESQWRKAGWPGFSSRR